MTDKSLPQELVDAFEVQGFVVLEPDQASIDWALRAKTMACQAISNLPRPKTGWYDLSIALALPQHEVLMSLMSALLVRGAEVPQSAQLSTLIAGYDESLYRHHCHVDGYAGKKTLAWHALLIGVLIVDLPDQEGLGSPVVWPGSHRLTRRTLGALKGNATPESVGEAIWDVPASSKSLQHLRIHGDAGTIFVMDHDLHHGMLPHTSPNSPRHIAYYRVPEAATDQVYHVVNRGHFFRV